MPIRVIQTTFSAGEISPEAINRVDLDFYKKSLSLGQNVYVNSTGNTVRREGSVMVALDNDVKRIEAVSFNGLQDYLFAFKTDGIDVYYEDNKVATIELELTESQISEFDFTQQADTIIIFHKDLVSKKILRKSSTSWELSDVTWTNIPYYAYGDITTSTPDSTIDYSTTTKKTKLTFGSSVVDTSWVGQKIYLDKGGALEIYKYTSDTVCWASWKVSPPDSDQVPSGEWELDTGYTQLFTSKESYAWQHATTDEVVFTDSATPNVDDSVYSDKYLNNEFRTVLEGLQSESDDTIYTQTIYERDSSNDIVGNRILIWKAWTSSNNVTVYTSPTVSVGEYVYTDDREDVLGTIYSFDSEKITAKIEYARYETDDYSAVQNPACGAFGKGRLYIGGIKGFESCICASCIDDYFNLDIGSAEDDEGILYKLDTFNPIQYLSFEQTLVANTSDSEHFLEYTTNSSITPSNFNMIQTSTHGCSCKPFGLDGITVFLEKSGCIVRSFVYDDVQRTYNAENLSVLAPHLIKEVSRVAVRKSYSENPNNVAYLLNNDGTITLFNLLREQKFRAFTRCETDGSYKDVCSVNDKVYCLCDREVGGETKRFIERFDINRNLDCSIVKESFQNETTWSDLDVFEGLEADVIGDDYFYSGKFEVSDGEITGVVGLSGQQQDMLGAEDGFKKVEVGFDYSIRLTTYPIEYNTDKDTVSVGKIKRLVYVNSKCIDTIGILIEAFDKKYYANYLKFGEETLNNEINLETGFKKVYCGGYGDILVLDITQEFPANFNLVALEIGVE